jgi:hypothetical protein
MQMEMNGSINDDQEPGAGGNNNTGANSKDTAGVMVELEPVGRSSAGGFSGAHAYSSPGK